MAGDENVLEWVQKDKHRMLHAVYRVGNLQKIIEFYTECLGMKLLRQRDIPEEKYSNAFLGFGPEDKHFVVELTYNYGVDSYDIGTGFGHFGIATEDVYKLVEKIRAKGGNVTRGPGPDPDGYSFELIQRGPTAEPLCQVMLRVGDLERSIKFYKQALGMKLLRKIDRPEHKIAISTDDVYKSGEVENLVTQELGGKITRQPGPIPGLNTKITSFVDPDGWKTVLVDNEDFLKELQ
ncbi:hypothetical protein MKX01_014254 [Papaver californicum]|nr:hypothetical protein MKX01_014254 [Papaver californicum]